MWVVETLWVLVIGLIAVLISGSLARVVWLVLGSSQCVHLVVVLLVGELKLLDGLIFAGQQQVLLFDAHLQLSIRLVQIANLCSDGGDLFDQSLELVLCFLDVGQLLVLVGQVARHQIQRMTQSLVLQTQLFQ